MMLKAKNLVVALGLSLAPLLTSCVSLLPTLPTVSIRASQTVGVAPFTVTFGTTLTVPDEDPEGDWRFVWDYGDGTTGEGADSTHTYQAPGRYKATLLVTNGDDFETERSLAVHVLLGASFDVTRYATGKAPLAVAALDLNLDQQPDLISANSENHSISVFLADGNVLRSSPYQYPAIKSPSPNPQPQSITLGDINHDGLTDLVVLNPPDDNLTILFGDGIGGFQTPSGYRMINPQQALVGDFDGDLNADVLVLSQRGDVTYVVLMRGKGTGELSLGETLFHYAQITDMTQGDFDRDGDLDLVLTTTSFGLEYIVLLNEGKSFAPPLYGLLQSKPLEVVSVDLDSDGHKDLITANEDGSLSLLRGDGQGAFNVSGTLDAALGTPVSLIAADLNGDHIDDLVVHHRIAGEDSVSMLLGDGMGRFSAATSIAGFSGGVCPVAADLDANGMNDLLMVSPQTNELLVGTNRASN